MSDTTGQPDSTGCFPKIDLFKKDGKWTSIPINIFKFLETQKNLIANRGYPICHSDDIKDQSKK